MYHYIIIIMSLASLSFSQTVHAVSWSARLLADSAGVFYSALHYDDEATDQGKRKKGWGMM